MNYDPKSDSVRHIMGLSVADLVATGALLVLGKLSATVEKTVEKSPDIPNARECGDCYLATCVAILLAECPDPTAVTNLAVAKIEESRTKQAVEDYSQLFSKTVGES